MKKILALLILIATGIFAGYFYETQIAIVSKLATKVAPNVFSPLTALIELETKTPTSVSICVKGKNGVADITHTFPNKSKVHQIPVLGLYLNQLTDVVLTVNGKYFSKEIPLKLETNYEIKLPQISVLKQTPKKDTFYFLDDGLIVDENGDIRFIFDKPENWIKYFIQGNIFAESRNQGIKRFDMLGNLIHTYRYPKGFTSFTHGMGVKPNGNILIIGGFSEKYLVYKGEQVPSHREFVLELDEKTGKVINTIDMAEILNPYRSGIVNPPNIDYGVSDWCHINGVDYDDTDNTIVVSCRHFGLSKIDEKTNKLVWLITPKLGLASSGRNGKKRGIEDKVLTALDAQGKILSDEFQKGYKASEEFRWPTKNHHPAVVNGKYFSIFNNAGDVFDKKISSTKNANALIYFVDKDKKTVQNIFQYQLDYTSGAGGAVTYQPESNSVTIYIADAYRNDSPHLSDGRIYRVDFTSHEVLFEAQIHRGGESYYYKATPFQWYTNDILNKGSRPGEYIFFVHPYWHGFTTISGNRLIRDNGDKATIVSNKNGQITVKWDKYGIETFIKDGNTYKLKEEK